MTAGQRFEVNGHGFTHVTGAWFASSEHGDWFAVLGVDATAGTMQLVYRLRTCDPTSGDEMADWFSCAMMHDDGAAIAAVETIAAEISRDGGFQQRPPCLACGDLAQLAAWLADLPSVHLDFSFDNTQPGRG